MKNKIQTIYDQANFILDNKIIFTIVRMNTMSIMPASDNVNQVLSCYGKWKMI